MKQVSDAFQVTGQNSILRRVATEQLVGRDQPVTAVWQRIADFSPQGFSFIIPHVPGSHYPKHSVISATVSGEQQPRQARSAEECVRHAGARPNGARESVQNAAADQLITVREDAGVVKREVLRCRHACRHGTPGACATW